MLTKQNQANTLTAALSLAASLCLMPVPAQACADVGAGIAILMGPMILPAALVAFFGRRGGGGPRPGFCMRLGLVAACMPVTFFLILFCYGILLDTHGLEGHNILLRTVVGSLLMAAPPVLPALWIGGHEDGSRTARVWAFTRNSMLAVFGLLLVTVVAAYVVAGA